MINQQISNESLYSHNQMKKAAFVETNKAALNYTKAEILNTLEKGDVIAGKIIQEQLGKLNLKLPNQPLIPIMLKENIPLNQLLDFIVIDNSGGVLQLKPYDMQNKMGVKDKVIQNFDLPSNEKMQECVQEFMDADLPLNKADLLKTYHLNNKLQIPLSVIMQMDKQLGIGANEFFESLQKSINQSPHDQAQQLKHTLLEDDGLTSVQQLENGIKVLEQLHDKQGIKVPIDLQKILNLSHQKEGFTLEQLKNQLTSIMNSGSEQNIDEVVDWIKQGFDKKFIISNKEDLLNREIKDMALYSSSEKILEMMDESKEFNLTTKGAQSLDDLKESARAWNKLNDVGEYYQYPMFLDHNKQQAEIYFFKPHKKKAAHKKDFYAVIALDFPSIKHIDIHVHQVDKMIELRIDVESERAQKLFNQKSEMLLEKIVNKGYQLKQYSCMVKTKQSELIHKDMLGQISKDVIEGINIKI